LSFGNIEAKLSEAYNKLNEIKAELSNVISREKDVYGELKEIEKEIEGVGERLEEVREMKRKMLSAMDRLKTIRRELDIYRYLDGQVFAENKLPLILLKHYVDRVTIYAQEYVDRLLGGRFVVNLVVTKSGVEVRVSSRGVERSTKALSMGERIALGFAVRLGIINALTEAKGATKPDFLIIDEGLSGLDEERRGPARKNILERRGRRERGVWSRSGRREGGEGET